jgi:hypothetical protein
MRSGLIGSCGQPPPSSSRPKQAVEKGVPLLACPAVFFSTIRAALLDEPAVAPNCRRSSLFNELFE